MKKITVVLANMTQEQVDLLFESLRDTFPDDKFSPYIGPDPDGQVDTVAVLHFNDDGETLENLKLN